MSNIKSLKICDLSRTPICELWDNTESRVRNIKESLKINEIIGLTFDFPVDNPKWTNIKNEYLVFYNGEYYKIKGASFIHDEDGKLYVHVECKHYSDNLANDLISIEETTPRNVVELMKIALCYDENDNPTKGWSVGNVTVDKVAKRGLEVMEQSPFSILLTIAEKYDGILRFNSQTMKVDMLKRHPTDRPTIDLRVSKNLKSVEINYDTTEMYTRLYCYGATDEDGNELDIMDANPTGKPYIDNFDYFYKLGYTKDFVEAHQELFVSTNIWRDDNYYLAQDLYDDGVKELAKIAQPIVSVKVTALDINTLSSNGNITKLNLGDCVRIYDEDLGVDTLCNVISREIDYEQPHLLNIEVTNSITYHDTLSKLFTNVNTVSSVVTSGGNIVGGQGTSMSDVKSYLNLYYLSAEQIEAVYASIENLNANYLTAEQIRTTYLDAESIGAKYATIANLSAVEAKIKDLDVDVINGKFARFEELFADNANFHKLVATDAEIEELQAGNITVTGKLKADKAELEELIATKLTTGDFEAYKATIENLIATKASIEELEANYIKASQIEATYAKITDLNALSGKFSTLEADLADIENLVVKKADIEDLNAANAKIETLIADVADIDTLLAKKVDAEYVQAEIVKATKVITDDLEAIHAVVDILDTKYATIEQLNATKANLETLIAKKATIEELNAAKADIGELDALVANINSILAGNIGTGTLQTIHLTAQNVVIDDAIIKSAMIEGLDVSKLNAGTISTDKFVIKSDNGGILVSGSTMQFKDKNNKVRLQVGQDAQGNFNFIVFGEDGTTAIYNENGITQNAVPDGLIVDKMVSDDAQIQGKKLDINSVVDKINEDGTKTINSTKIWIDEENQSLGAKFNTIEESINTNSSDLSNFIKQTTKDLDSLQGQIDGSIQTFFYEYVPTNSNIPAKDWTTTELKNSHLGDLFYDTLTGYCYRWQVANNQYSWQRITDVDVTKALADAAKAQDTANNKRRVFVTTPNPPYDIGDLWSQGSTGDLMRCKVAKTEAQTYASSDWEKASKYTDDTKANEVNSKLTTLQTDFEVEQGKISTLISKTEIIEGNVSNAQSTADSALENANSANEKFDNLEIGGRNLLLNSKMNYIPSGISETIVYKELIEDDNYGTVLHVKCDYVYQKNFLKMSFIPVVGEKYLITFFAKSLNSNSFRCVIHSGTTAFSDTIMIKTSDTWSKCTGKLTIRNAPEGNANLYFYPSNDEYWIKDIKIEKGNKATDWTPAPEDIDASINDVKDNLTTLTNQYNQTVQTVEGNTTQIGNIKTIVDETSGKVVEMESNITEIKQTADGVSTIVSSNKGKWDKASTDATNAQTIANQTADKISWIVKSGSSSTNFELTDRTAELVANNINLKGLVTFSGLNTDVQNKINTAYDTSDKNNSTINDWVSEAINEGIAQINGGYIKAHTIDIDHLIVDSIFAEGTSVMNIINSQAINADRIASGIIKSKFLELYGMRVLQKNTNLETLSITENGEVTLRGSVESYNYKAGQSGWSIRSNGDAEFNNVIVRGDLINTDGGISSDISENAKTVRFWAGTSYEEREYAPFIVYNDGSVIATKGEFSGLWTGNIEIGNISIIDPSKTSGNDAILTIQNGQNGIKRVQLNDTEISSFAQKLIITDNAYNTVIALNQDGTAIFNNGISIGNNTSINKDTIILNGFVLGTNSNGYVFNSPQLDIGSVSNNSLLNVYGESYLNGVVHVEKTINFNNVIECTVSSNGLDFNFINDNHNGGSGN